MVIIGTIENKLAEAYAQHLQDKISEFDVDSEIVVAKTSAGPNDGIESVIDELNRALLNKDIDVVVLPMEHLGSRKVDGLQVAGLSERKSANDVIISADKSILDEGPLKLKEGTTVAVTSDLREALLEHYFNHVEPLRISGNILSQVEGLKAGKYDAVMTDKASLEWMNYVPENLFVRDLSPREFVPAPAQGVLAFQCRSNDDSLKQLLAMVHRADVADLTNVERSILLKIDSDKPFVLGAYCEESGLNYRTHAAFKEMEDGAEMRVARALHISTSELANSILSELNTAETDA